MTDRNVLLKRPYKTGQHPRRTKLFMYRLKGHTRAIKTATNKIIIFFMTSHILSSAICRFKENVFPV